jgi:hypothetical protein
MRDHSYHVNKFLRLSLASVQWGYLPVRIKPYWSADCRSLLFFVNETAGSSYNESRLAVVHKHVSR